MADEKKDAAHGSLEAAVLAVQGAVGTLTKDAENPHFKSKFTPLDTIVESVQPHLTANGLVWRTYPTTKDGAPALRYRMSHPPTGEHDEDTMLLMVQKADPQGQGSALTYARRYSLCAYLNLVADVDDDGNAATKAAGEQNRALANAKANMSVGAVALLAQADELWQKTDVPAAKYKQWQDATGYTTEGLQRLVDHLKTGLSPV